MKKLQGVGLLVMAVAAGVTTAQAQETASLQAAFLAEEYGSVLSKTQQLLGGRDTQEKDLLLYLQGVSAFKLRDLDLAIDSLQRLAADYPESSWAVPGQMVLGQLFSASGEDEKALKLYQKLLKEDPTKPMRVQVTFLLGKAQRRLGQWSQARASFESVLSQAPQSPPAQEARQILEGEDFYFTVQVGAFETKANALRLKAECERRGYPTQVSEAFMQGRRLYRVRVGQFSQREEAEQEAQRLKGEGFPARVAP